MLLENNGVLPLQRGKKVLLTGPNANSIWAMCGDYTFPSMFYFWQSWKKEWDDSRIAWPFGYGMSYTTFEYANLQMDSEATTDSEALHLSFDVKNTGNMKADEIAQIYLSPTQPDQNIRPIQLQGFARISLNPGETKTVKVKLYTEQLGYYSHTDKRQWNIAPGTFEIKVGASSEDIRLNGKVVLKGNTTVKPLRDHYFSEVEL